MKKSVYNLKYKSQSQKQLLLLSLDWTRPKDPPSSLGHASILAHLNQNKLFPINHSWSVNHPSFNVSQVLDFIYQQPNYPDVALGAFVWNESSVQKIINTLKNYGYPGRVILGGPQISYTKSDLEQYYPSADVFIRGYAEEALLKYVVSDQSKPRIAGVHYAGDVDLGLSANSDIESLASPYLTGIIQPNHFIRIETQRGCPFRCSFCQHRESDITMQRRLLDKTRIKGEIEWITKNPVIQDIAVLDPTFNSGPNYMEILRTFLENGYTGKLSLQCRMEMCNSEFLELVEEFNKKATVTLEFGLQTIHREEQRLIQRPNNMARVKNVLRETKQRNIPTELSLIFGLPNQTLESFKDSVNFCKQQQVPTIYAFPLMLLRGTPLHDQKAQLGLIESTDVNLNVPRVQNEIPHVVASPSFSQNEWQQMAKIAESLDQYNQENKEKTNESVGGKMRETLKHTLWKNPENKMDENNQKDLELSLSDRIV